MAPLKLRRAVVPVKNSRRPRPGTPPIPANLIEQATSGALTGLFFLALLLWFDTQGLTELIRNDAQPLLPIILLAAVFGASFAAAAATALTMFDDW